VTLELICLLLGVLLFILFLSDFYKSTWGARSGKIIWIFRVAEAVSGLLLGYFFALYTNLLGPPAVLVGFAAATLVSALAYSVCSKGLARDAVDTNLLEVVDVIERCKSDLVASIKDAGAILVKDAEAKVSVSIDGARREIERLGHNIDAKMSFYTRYMEERLKVMDEALRIVREGPRILESQRESVKKLERLCAGLDKVHLATTSVHEKLEKSVAELRSAVNELHEKIQRIGASTKELKKGIKERIVNLLRANGFEVIEGQGRDEPNLMVKLQSRPVFVAALRAFNLSRGVPQRSISLKDIKEREIARENNVDLIVFIGNVANERLWACLINKDELGTDTYIDTPRCLVEEEEEALAECRNSIMDILRRYIPSPRVDVAV